MSEYQELSVRELLEKAMDIREDSGPLLEEGERRDRSPIEELAAVVGKPLPPNVWTPIGIPFFDTGEYSFAVCVLHRGAAVGVGRMGAAMQESVPELRQGGGSWRDEGRNE